MSFRALAALLCLASFCFLSPASFLALFLSLSDFSVAASSLESDLVSDVPLLDDASLLEALGSSASCGCANKIPGDAAAMTMPASIAYNPIRIAFLLVCVPPSAPAASVSPRRKNGRSVRE